MRIKGILTKFVCIFCIVLALAACNNKKQADQSKVLAEADRFYSALSAEKGMNAAFLAMFDSSGVLLRPNHPPIAGHEAIKQLLLSHSDTAFILTWEPSYSKIAVSGDLGYTYGTYKVRDRATDSISGEGTYATVWLKSADGTWKAVLDTGNPGLGTEN